MFCDEHGTADYCGECVYGPEIERLIAERDAAKTEARELRHAAGVANTTIRELRAELARVRELSPEVLAFSHLMQHKLDMNAHKDGSGWDRDGTGKRGWKHCDVDFLFDKLDEETDELKAAVFTNAATVEIANEAADVGNIAMMLADIFGALSQPAEQTAPPCDCAELVDGVFINRCDCRNMDDYGAMEVWCHEMNKDALSPAQPPAPPANDLPLMARRASWTARYAAVFSGGEVLLLASRPKKVRPDVTLHRVADTDEHGLKVVPRPAEAPDGTKYRYRGSPTGWQSYSYYPPQEFRYERQRIEDYRPAGSMCAGCEASGANCSSLPFHTMPVIGEHWGVKIVRCTQHKPATNERFTKWRGFITP